MKRSNINRHESSASSGSAMVETLESRQMSCYAPANIPVHELMDPAFEQQALETRPWTDAVRGDQTSGSTALTKTENVS